MADNEGIYKMPITISCNYGTVGENSKHYNVYDSLKEKILDYKLTKIKCQLKSNESIYGIQFFYRNTIDGKEIPLINFKSEQKDLIDQEMSLNGEDIIDLRVWLKNVKLTGFEVTTNKNRIQKFGYGNDEDLIKITDLEKLDQVLVGFGVCADERDGVTSLYFYNMSKKDYVFFIYSGVFSLKIKLKNEEFKKKIDSKISNMSEKNKLLYRVCSLPDNQFFNIVRYALE